MPRQLTKRGHRLVFSNGIISLAGGVDGCWSSLFEADVDQADPALRDRRVHLVHAVAGRHGQAPPPAAGAGLAGRPVRSTALGAFPSPVVTVDHRRSRSSPHGAWAVIVLVPVMVWLLVRLNHQYEARARGARGEPRADRTPNGSSVRSRCCSWMTSTRRRSTRSVREDDPRRRRHRRAHRGGPAARRSRSRPRGRRRVRARSR